jgi:hypothetical protein
MDKEIGELRQAASHLAITSPISLVKKEAAMTGDVRRVVSVSTKSMGVAIILTVIFGPLGMLYSTILGGIIMGIISLIVGVLTFGIGLVITWPICVIWAAVAANSYNNKLLTGNVAH